MRYPPRAVNHENKKRNYGKLLEAFVLHPHIQNTHSKQLHYSLRAVSYSAKTVCAISFCIQVVLTHNSIPSIFLQ